ncbi:MAG: pyruvoyl-dependent arginine decarboxylase [Bacteroidota bacterium]|nr:pyruvoyl-dependent arginine decarboxylase [Bacteroidota bacterium]MDP4225041.1 pyruvoyl-dependent arginine decarboxylase [Bacteroidota bacterium]MDP4273746.1 pyruvoyl-dependent arginine decarboxylase [Bacteroidota bacterium]
MSKNNLVINQFNFLCTLMMTQILKQKSFPDGMDFGGVLFGNRIPQDYFETKGIGQSDIAIHAGSYHLALKAAGIEMYNIITYSSILPGIAKRVEKPTNKVHGAVMESIMSVCHAQKGERASAGIIYGWLYDKQTNDKFGGLVCEHYGNCPEEEIQQRLNASLNELYVNGFSEKYNLLDIHTITESFVPEKNYGTALVALCFTSYYYPIISSYDKSGVNYLNN